MYNNCGQVMRSVEGESSNLSETLSFKCANQNVSSKTKNYVLSKTQYINTIEDLFGSAAITAAAAPISALATDFNDEDNNRITTISPTQAQAYYDIANTIANYVMANNNRITNLFGSCAIATSPSANCIDTYLNGFAQRILRRPLTAAEITFAKTKVMVTSGTYKENLKALLIYHLISPSFLWPIELGTGTNISHRFILTPYEVVSRLSYLITDSTPDAALISSASDGSIMTPLGLQQQVQRLLKTNRGKTKIINSILRWSLADKAEDISSLPSLLLNGLNTTGLQSAMLSEAHMFVDYILYTQNGTLKDLLTSKLSFASHQGLAAIYGHTPISGNQPVTVTERRQGILMKAPFYTWSTPRTNIILRGVNFQKRVLCNVIPPPSIDIANNRNALVLTDAELLTVTNRTAITYQTGTPLCMSCHSVINSTGFSFENIDPAGRIRSQEMIFDQTNNFAQALPIHSNTSIPLGGSSGDLSVSDAYDFVTYLSTSPIAAACVTRNIYRGLYEKKEEKEDDCQLEESFNLTKQYQQPLLDSIEKIFTSSSIYYKEL